jgi:hypothetical protein
MGDNRDNSQDSRVLRGRSSARTWSGGRSCASGRSTTPAGSARPLTPPPLDSCRCSPPPPPCSRTGSATSASAGSPGSTRRAAAPSPGRWSPPPSSCPGTAPSRGWPTPSCSPPSAAAAWPPRSTSTPWPWPWSASAPTPSTGSGSSGPTSPCWPGPCASLEGGYDYALADGFPLPHAGPGPRGQEGRPGGRLRRRGQHHRQVTRDKIMTGAARRYRGYGFQRHKGYGTDEHWAALRRLGPSATIATPSRAWPHLGQPVTRR